MAKKTLKYSADNINRLLEKIDQLDLSDVTGKAPNLFIGTVTTLPSGSNATATITPSGTDSYFINLGIPKGDKGDAPTIKVGTVTQGSIANVVIREVGGELLFDFTLPKGEKGDTGDKGDKGDKGEKGDAPTIKVGTITQGTANVAIREVNGEYLFDFTLPNGSGGGTAPTIKVGTVTQGVTANVTMREVGGEHLLDFTLPKGDKGEKGDKGDKGADGKTPNFTIGTVTTLNSDQNATVTISGTFPNLVLNFGIPRGKDSTSTTPSEPTTPTEYMYYGRLPIEDVGGRVIQYNEITEAMILKGVTDGKLTKATPHTLGKTSLGKYSQTARGDYQIVIVPAANGFTVTKDNGLGGKTRFDEDTSGANGIDITINTIPCKLYGEMLTAQGETFIYID